MVGDSGQILESEGGEEERSDLLKKVESRRFMSSCESALKAVSFEDATWAEVTTTAKDVASVADALSSEIACDPFPVFSNSDADHGFHFVGTRKMSFTP